MADRTCTSFAQALRHELEDHGVSVTALMPGPTETEFFERADLTDTKLGQAKVRPRKTATRRTVTPRGMVHRHVLRG